MKNKYLLIGLNVLLSLLILGCSTVRYGKLSYVEMSPTKIDPANGALKFKGRCATIIGPDNMYSEIGQVLQDAKLKGLKNFRAGIFHESTEGQLVSCVSVIGEKE
ncbi:hypothetical protein AB3N61_13945 [Leptospira sp. WS58.C1]|uniref:hypothetical protein n=1 Tax=Leptospira TaxID=171 RepID=UPI0002BFE427|nr:MULTISPECIES: hypothetical protein [unclassified Leptospira]EMJ98812.1 putative lipoprotein [Leptospira sp. B5-022]MCR1794173.1 hypothetical protein [Leptospira sp. id769339]